MPYGTLASFFLPSAIAQIYLPCQDRRAITMGDLIEPAAPTELTQVPVRREEDEDLTGIRAGSSAKVDHLVTLLKMTPAHEKSLVFSQFTGFLDKVGFIPFLSLSISHCYNMQSDRRDFGQGRVRQY